MMVAHAGCNIPHYEQLHVLHLPASCSAPIRPHQLRLGRSSRNYAWIRMASHGLAFWVRIAIALHAHCIRIGLGFD